MLQFKEMNKDDAQVGQFFFPFPEADVWSE